MGEGVSGMSVSPHEVAIEKSSWENLAKNRENQYDGHMDPRLRGDDGV